ncbi:hypothetical protein SCH4B_0437 [Ruegeria sp. TrichCH4B]|nr:hypothetical protein SCH4B_0437 [Ruegeria sp. TrichCH4B]
MISAVTSAPKPDFTVHQTRKRTPQSAVTVRHRGGVEAARRCDAASRAGGHAKRPY